MIKKTILIVSLLVMGLTNFTKAQEETSEGIVSVDYTADIVSRYVWRGLLMDASPNIQPYLGVNIGSFTIGSWASYSFHGYLPEIDLFMTYNLGDYFSISLYDYFNEDESDLSMNEYFNWERKTTTHALEGTIAWNGIESFPLKATLATFFYGNDRNDDLDQYYSTYFELGYPFNISNMTFDVFAGAALNEGFYNDEANLVNIGFSTTKEIEITEKFTLPLKGTLSVNPANEDIFFVVGITF